MLLSNFEYKIFHISGEDNCWADLLSRWGSDESSAALIQRLAKSVIFA